MLLGTVWSLSSVCDLILLTAAWMWLAGPMPGLACYAGLGSQAVLGLRIGFCLLVIVVCCLSQ